MENLFTTMLSMSNVNVKYKVVFDQGRYTFFPNSSGTTYPIFSLKREHDEWQNADVLVPELREQAINALEKYLLKQH